MAGDAAIRVEGFSFGIGGAPILKDVSLDVRECEFVSVIGPNGAGKTTLLKCVMRILAGGSGCISVLGKPLDRYSQRELARAVSYVPQGDDGLCPFTVREFVLMGRYPFLSPFSPPAAGDRAAAARVLELTGTSAFADRIVGTLSGGERRKVFIAAALAQEAGIMLLDEPAAFLDYRHRVEIMGLITQLNREEGITVVMVTHDISTAVLTGDRVVALKEGAPVFAGTPAELTCGRRLEEIYGVPFRFVEHPETGLPVALPHEEAR